MAAHVRVGDVVEHVVQEPIGAVHGGQRAAQPVPLARLVVRQRRVPASQNQAPDCARPRAPCRTPSTPSSIEAWGYGREGGALLQPRRCPCYSSQYVGLNDARKHKTHVRVQSWRAHVCCSSVMVTSQALTTRYGTTYTCARRESMQIQRSSGLWPAECSSFGSLC